MNRITGSALVVAMIASLSLPAVASETSVEALSKDPLVISGCKERAAEENIPAEGIEAYVKTCLEDLANELPEGEDKDQMAKTKRDSGKAAN